jgi:hypothetical protein
MKKVLSVSPAKNLQMVVYHNVDEFGRKFSITRFEPLNAEKPCYRRAFGLNGKPAR